MRILLIKPKHIGDALILTPTIAGIRQAHPGAEIWVLVRAGTEGILAGSPDIARILSLAGVEKSDRSRGDLWRQARVAMKLLTTRFDYVFELGDGHRARLFAMLARTKRRYSVKTSSPLKPFEARHFSVSSFDWKTCHRVEKDYYSVSEFLPLPEGRAADDLRAGPHEAVGPGDGAYRFLRGASGLATGLQPLAPGGLARGLPRPC